MDEAEYCVKILGNCKDHYYTFGNICFLLCNSFTFAIQKGGKKEKS